MFKGGGENIIWIDGIFRLGNSFVECNAIVCYLLYM